MREEGLALFDAFASKEKWSHVNSGRHKELPRFEAGASPSNVSRTASP